MEEPGSLFGVICCKEIRLEEKILNTNQVLRLKTIHLNLVHESRRLQFTSTRTCDIPKYYGNHRLLEDTCYYSAQQYFHVSHTGLVHFDTQVTGREHSCSRHMDQEHKTEMHNIPELALEKPWKKHPSSWKDLSDAARARSHVLRLYLRNRDPCTQALFE